jgi:putative intracellular protease/amidase
MKTRILIARTSHSQLGRTGRTTGFYLSEAAEPYKVFIEAGYEVDFVSPQGGEPPMDGVNLDEPIQKAFLENPQVMAKIHNTLRPEGVNPADYDAILYVGGHGVMWDFPENTQLAKVAAAIYENEGVVAAVCHGPAGLVNIKLSDGSYLINGKTVSAFTNEEEAALGLTEVVPFLLESKLRERGAQITKAPNFQAHTAVSERLVTGQNPASAMPVARQVLAVLARRIVTA